MKICCTLNRISFTHKITMLTVLVCCIILFVMIVKTDTLISGNDIKLFSKRRLLKHLDDNKIHQIIIETDHILHNISERFLSFSIDSSVIQKGLRNPSLRNIQLRKTILHLGGGYLRIGGHAADLLQFSPAFRTWPKNYVPLDGGKCAYEHKYCQGHKNNTKFFMSANDWQEINEFAKAASLKVLFDLNAWLRINNTWNTQNAEILLDNSFANMYDVDWELGNEPNSYRHIFGKKILPKQFAADYLSLKKLLQRYKLYRSSLLVGPEVTNPRILETSSEKYLEKFLSFNPPIDAVTWHHYYTGPEATSEVFLNPETFNSFRDDCQAIKGIIRKSKASVKAIWIGETGSSYGGGASKYADSWITSLLWLDKLGISAFESISVVIRQSLYRGVYGLLSPDLIPNPDYWVSLMHKHLLGTKVLKASVLKKIDTLRIYAHCSKDDIFPSVFGVNIANYSQGMKFTYNCSAEFYLLEGNNGLLSKKVLLNGDILQLNSNYDLPPLLPEIINLENPVIVPPHSIFFLKLYLNETVCLAN